MRSTIVIPNYNGKDFLEKCLKSLQKCSTQDFGVIVVDNGSTDGSVEMLGRDFPEVKLIAFEENTGFAPAVNTGIAASTTEYVILLNNDTEVDEHFVEALEAAMEADDKIFSASSKMVDMHNPDILDGAGDYYCALGWAYAYGKGKRCDSACRKTKKIFSACAGAAIYRKSVLEYIGNFDENHFAYLEDVDVGYRGRIAGYKNIYAPEAICYHAGSGSSGSRYNEFKIKLSSRNSIYLVLKNMPLLQLLINLPFLLIGFAVKTLFFTLKGYGVIYVKGLFAGIKMYFGAEGHKHKVRFKCRNIFHYIAIQFELWINILRRLWA